MRTRLPHRPIAIATVAVFGVAALAGCGGSPSTDAQADDRQEVAQAMPLPDAKLRATWPKQEVTSGLAAGMKLPLEDYMIGYPDMVDVENAKDVVKQACMNRLGFSYTPEPMGSEPAPAYNEINMKRRYGLTDRAEAAENGFTPPQALQQNAQDDEAEVARQDKESSAEGWDEAMSGTCVPEANKEVGVLFETDLAGELASASLDATSARPAVNGAMAAWASCMKSRGHSVKTPDEASKRFGTRALPGLTPGKEEVALATDDVDCKETSHLVAAWYEEETGYQTEQIASHKKDLEEEKARNTAMVKRARAVLADAARK
ncbi:hypothetical protein ACFUTY_27270 [Streptomyces sp. NPDC057362]|uniref:hypothetical protein n=1 Tax=Streptomyces sp. NPDC057362 TaxID=3346106 RepID=UPI00362B15F0